MDGWLSLIFPVGVAATVVAGIWDVFHDNFSRQCRNSARQASYRGGGFPDEIASMMKSHPQYLRTRFLSNLHIAIGLPIFAVWSFAWWYFHPERDIFFGIFYSAVGVFGVFGMFIDHRVRRIADESSQKLMWQAI